MSKIIFSDLDATLLRDDKTISTQDMESIQRAIRQGHKFVVATGRSFESALAVTKSLKLDLPGCYIASYNGGQIYDCMSRKVISNRTLPMSVLRELFERANAAGVYCQTYVDGKVTSYRMTEELEYYCLHAALEAQADEHFLDKMTQEANKALLIHLTDHEKLQRFWDENADWAEGKIDFIFSSRIYLEAMPHGVSKATAVEDLTKLLGMDIADTIAMGDEQNDISMIRAAGIGVAMKNGIDAAKDVADYVTEHTNNESPMTEILEKFLWREGNT